MSVNATPAGWHDLDVVFRCDAGAHHGLGHLSRALTVAHASREAGWRAGFVVSAPVDMCARVTQEGWPVRLASGPVGDPQDDPHLWMPERAKVVVIDSKAAQAGWVEACGRGRRTLSFDDEVARDLPCDVIVNNHVWARETDYAARPGRRLLLGPAYNTVRADYFAFAHGVPGDGLLVTLGGEDPHNHTAWLIEHLADLIDGMPVIVCIGPAHPDPARVMAVCAADVPHAQVLMAPASLVDAVRRSRVALSAAGTTCYELAAAGVAFGVLAVEDHQDRMADAVVGSGAAVRLGRFDDLDPVRVRQAFAQLMAPDSARAMRDAGQRLMARPGAPGIVAAFQDAA